MWLLSLSYQEEAARATTAAAKRGDTGGGILPGGDTGGGILSGGDTEGGVKPVGGSGVNASLDTSLAGASGVNTGGSAVNARDSGVNAGASGVNAGGSGVDASLDVSLQIETLKREAMALKQVWTPHMHMYVYIYIPIYTYIYK